MKTIGFIGLGHMGHPMAVNLFKAGFNVIAYDVSTASMQAIEKAGLSTTDSLIALAKTADVIITSVQTGAQVNEICLGAEGIFHGLSAEKLFIDCSSIDVLAAQTLHSEAKNRHIAMLDAPVSGGVSGAAAGTLTFMVGGSEEHYQRALPILTAMGKNIIHAGQAGMGQAAKICNNLLLGISMIGVAEAFNLAKKLGLDQKTFFDISSHSSGQCWSMTTYCPVPGILENVPASHHYQPGFMGKMMLKDLRLGQDAATMVHAAIPLGQVAIDLYEEYVNQGDGEKDFSGIINLIASHY